MKLEAKTPEEDRLKKYLDENASEALREKIAALPDRFNLDAAYRYITGEARKYLKHGGGGFIDDAVVYCWLVHYYEDVAPAEAAKPAPAKAQEEAKPRSARKGASARNRKPAAAAGSSKRHTSSPDPATALPEPPSLGGGSGSAPQGASTSAAGDGTSSPDAAVDLGPAATTAGAGSTASAAASGFSFALFDSEGGAS